MQSFFDLQGPLLLLRREQRTDSLLNTLATFQRTVSTPHRGRAAAKLKNMCPLSSKLIRSLPCSRHGLASRRAATQRAARSSAFLRFSRAPPTRPAVQRRQRLCLQLRGSQTRRPAGATRLVLQDNKGPARARATLLCPVRPNLDNDDEGDHAGVLSICARPPSDSQTVPRLRTELDPLSGPHRRCCAKALTACNLTCCFPRCTDNQVMNAWRCTDARPLARARPRPVMRAQEQQPLQRRRQFEVIKECKYSTERTPR